MKKIFKAAIVLTVAACIVFSCSLVSMADDVYGTYEDGITAGLYQSNTHQVPHVEGFKNADFKEGLKYWTTTPPKSKASDFVDLLKEGDKNYVSLTPRRPVGRHCKRSLYRQATGSWYEAGCYI